MSFYILVNQTQRFNVSTHNSSFSTATFYHVGIFSIASQQKSLYC